MRYVVWMSYGESKIQLREKRVTAGQQLLKGVRVDKEYRVREHSTQGLDSFSDYKRDGSPREGHLAVACSPHGQEPQKDQNKEKERHRLPELTSATTLSDYSPQRKNPSQGQE